MTENNSLPNQNNLYGNINHTQAPKPILNVLSEEDANILQNIITQLLGGKFIPIVRQVEGLDAALVSIQNKLTQLPQN